MRRDIVVVFIERCGVRALRFGLIFSHIDGRGGRLGRFDAEERGSELENRLADPDRLTMVGHSLATSYSDGSFDVVATNEETT